MKWFKHKCRFDRDAKAIMVESIATGVPVEVAHVSRCRCGDTRTMITPAGYQQISWGADPERDWPGYAAFP